MNYKIVLLTVMCALTVGPGFLHAQEPRNALSIDLFLPAMSPVSRIAYGEMVFVPLNVKYQRVLGDHNVLMVKMGLNYSWDSHGERILDLYPMLALDWHPFNAGLKGFYLGPSLLFSYSSYSHSGATVESDLDHSYWTAVGGNIGYGYVLPSGTVIDLIFGLGYGYAKEVDVKGRTSTSGYRVDETIGGVFVGRSF